MNFKEAKKKVKKLAGGKCHSVKYDLSEHASGEVKQVCEAYIDGLSFFTGENWEIVLARIDLVVNPPKEEGTEVDDIEET